VSGGLIELQAALGVFFHQQKTTVLFEDGGDSDVGHPDHALDSFTKRDKQKRQGNPCLSE
jgi:hypothetical protein